MSPMPINTPALFFSYFTHYDSTKEFFLEKKNKKTEGDRKTSYRNLSVMQEVARAEAGVGAGGHIKKLPSFR